MTSRNADTSRSMSDSEATIGGAGPTGLAGGPLARNPLGPRAPGDTPLGLLGEDPLGQQRLGDLPPGHLVRCDVDAGPQTPGAHGVDALADQVGEPDVQLLAELRGALLELAGLEHLHDLAPDGGGQRVAA